jgi:hypothetical protein
MTREEFWEIIDAARGAALFDRARLADALAEELAEIDEDEAADFARHFRECRSESNRQELFAAAWTAGGGASAEDFSDFRDWLITLGREAFEDALHDPQRILDHAEPADWKDPFDAEVGRVAMGEDDDDERPDPREPAGRKWEPGELARRFPKLWRAYNP